MKNIKLLHISLALSFLFIVASCSKDDDVDTEKPKITINTPKDKAHLHPKDVIHADFDISDNVELASWKIDIHWAGDGHEHSAATTQDETPAKKWEFKSNGDVSGKKNAHVHEHITVPEGIEGGDHHFCVYAVDKAGNESLACVDLDIHVAHGGH